MKKVIFFIGLIFITSQCSSQKIMNPSGTMKNSEDIKSAYPVDTPRGITRLKEKEKIFLANEKMNITFLKVIDDNRCPKNIKCTSEGEALIEIEVMGVYTRPRSFIVSNNKTDGRNSFIFNGKKIILENLYPEKEDTHQGEYIIDLRIESTMK